MNSKNSSRRKFIQKSGAVAGVTIIPSKSVWGMCNSSGVSGGSKDTSDSCSFIPSDLEGRSPGTWTKFLAKRTAEADSSNQLHGRDEEGLKKIKGAFAQYPYNWNQANGPERFLLKKIYDEINDEIWSAAIVLSTGSDAIPAKTLVISAALSSNGGIDWQLASVYLNLKFGFTSLPQPFLYINDYMAHLWGVANVVYSSHSAFEAVVESQQVDKESYMSFSV